MTKKIVIPSHNMGEDHNFYLSDSAVLYGI